MQSELLQIKFTPIVQFVKSCNYHKSNFHRLVCLFCKIEIYWSSLNNINID